MGSNIFKSAEGTSCVCDNCADVYWKDEESMLMKAVQNGHDKCVEAVIRSGADVNMKHIHGWTALMSAAFRGEMKCVEILIAAGAGVNLKNVDGKTALFFALHYARGTDVKSFLGVGVDVNVEDNGGKASPVTVAYRKLERCIELLIQAGADVNIQDYCGYGVLHYGACITSPNEIISGFESFIRAGADVNLADPNGTTAMHLLLEHQRYCPSTMTYVKRFLAAGASVNMADNQGTFIDIFSSFYRIDQREAKFIKLLFAAGDKITKPSDKVRKVLNVGGQMNLRHLCREAIRKHLLEMDPHENLFRRVPRLGLPAALQSFLLYDKTLDDDNDVYGQTITSILDSS